MRDAQVFALVPGAIRGLGQSSGFTMQLQNTQRHEPRGVRGGARPAARSRRNADPTLTSGPPERACPTSPRSRSTSNQQKLTALGLSQGDVNNTLSTAWGGRYVNDFVDRGRVKRVYVQGDAPYRAAPSEPRPMVRPHRPSGEMAPFSSFAQTGWATGAEQPVALPGRSRLRVPGPAGARATARARRWTGSSSSPSQIPGISVAWAGQSYQERLSSGQAPLLYAISLLVVFLCLAALYESWSIPVAVLLVIPLGLVGAIFAVTLRGLENDVYLQIGLLTTMGLAAKNAILMIEFAERAEKEGQARHRRGARGRADPAAADPDDQLRLHLRRAAAGASRPAPAPTAASPSAPR